MKPEGLLTMKEGNAPVSHRASVSNALGASA